MPESLQLAPLDVQEQRLYTDPSGMAELATLSLRESQPLVTVISFFQSITHSW